MTRKLKYIMVLLMAGILCSCQTHSRIDLNRLDAEDFSEGLAPLLVGDKVGYVNEKGELIIPPKFFMAMSFSEGLAEVYVTIGQDLVCGGDWSMINNINKFGFINREGEYVILPQFDDACSFKNGLAAVCINNKWGFIDKTGLRVIPFQFEDVETGWQFSSGLALVKLNGKWGYINRNGFFEIKPQFEEAEPFSPIHDKCVMVKSDGKYFFIDRKGQIVIPEGDRRGHVTCKPDASIPPPTKILPPP